MIEKLLSLVMFLAILSCGLMVGIFFTFSVFVMRALGRLPANEGISAMQSINITILNPLFFVVFFGAISSCMFLVFATLTRSTSIYTLLGSISYLLGSFLVTMIVNVPMNNRLAAVNPMSSEAARVWANYLTNWTTWNHVRTVAALVAMALLVVGLCMRER